jgi:hypothetical protein
MKANHLDVELDRHWLTTSERVGDGSPDSWGFHENAKLLGESGEAWSRKDDPDLTTNADLANSRGKAESPRRPVPSAADLGLIGSATTPSTGCTPRARRWVPIPFTQASDTDPAEGSGCAVGAGTPWSDPDVHPASPIAAAARMAATPRLIRPVEHRLNLESSPYPPNGMTAHGHRMGARKTYGTLRIQ